MQGVIIIKRIAVVTTGGTIAMKADHTGLASPSLSGDDLIAAIPSLKKRAAVDVFAFCNVPSSYITMDHLVRLRNYIDQLGEQGYAGVVVTHGTDTMEETAYFLDLTMQSSIPVVLTGAQRNPSLVSSDGPANLLDSILVAADDRAHEMGVLIVFASEIVAAREATKFHRTRVDTFKSLEFGPMGAVNNDRVIWCRKPQREPRYIIEKADKRVDIVNCYIGADLP